MASILSQQNCQVNLAKITEKDMTLPGQNHCNHPVLINLKRKKTHEIKSSSVAQSTVLSFSISHCNLELISLLTVLFLKFGSTPEHILVD